MRAGRAVLAAAFALALGCGSDEPKRSTGQPNARSAPQAPVPDAPVVFLRARAWSTSSIDVVAGGIDRDVHGVAFRLHFDPARLRIERATASGAWSSRALALAKEGIPGELAVVWTETGDVSGVPAHNEIVLGTIEVTRTGDGAALEIRAERSTVRDRDGATIDVRWIGGEI